MPLRWRKGRRVTVREPLPPPIYSDLTSPAFGLVGREIRAVIQPLSGSTAATLYGEESVHMRLMLTTDAQPLREGMGVCVDRRDGACDYRVAAPPERWGTHQRAVLKKL